MAKTRPNPAGEMQIPIEAQGKKSMARFEEVPQDGPPEDIAGFKQVAAQPENKPVPAVVPVVNDVPKPKRLSVISEMGSFEIIVLGDPALEAERIARDGVWRQTTPNEQVFYPAHAIKLIKMVR